MISEENWEWHYALLDEEGRKNPMAHLINYCSQDSLFNQRQKLYEVFSRYFASRDFKEWPREERARLIWFYRTMQEILEAGCRVMQLVKDGQLTYVYREKRDS